MCNKYHRRISIVDSCPQQRNYVIIISDNNCHPDAIILDPIFALTSAIFGAAWKNNRRDYSRFEVFDCVIPAFAFCRLSEDFRCRHEDIPNFAKMTSVSSKFRHLRRRVLGCLGAPNVVFRDVKIIFVLLRDAE